MIFGGTSPGKEINNLQLSRKYDGMRHE